MLTATLTASITVLAITVAMALTGCATSQQPRAPKPPPPLTATGKIKATAENPPFKPEECVEPIWDRLSRPPVDPVKCAKAIAKRDQFYAAQYEAALARDLVRSPACLTEFKIPEPILQQLGLTPDARYVTAQAILRGLFMPGLASTPCGAEVCSWPLLRDLRRPVADRFCQSPR